MVAATAVALSLTSGCAVAGDDYLMSRHPNIEAADFNAQQAIERTRATKRGPQPKRRPADSRPNSYSFFSNSSSLQ
jgi:hypothetical protein